MWKSTKGSIAGKDVASMEGVGDGLMGIGSGEGDTVDLWPVGDFPLPPSFFN
jgi:hypothetical protein